MSILELPLIILASMVVFFTALRFAESWIITWAVFAVFCVLLVIGLAYTNVDTAQEDTAQESYYSCDSTYSSDGDVQIESADTSATISFESRIEVIDAVVIFFIVLFLFLVFVVYDARWGD